MPEREPDEPPCTPEQAVQLARYCPNENFEKLRSLGTWQAAHALAQAQRMEQEAKAEIFRTTAEKIKAARSWSNFGFAMLLLLVLLVWIFL